MKKMCYIRAAFVVFKQRFHIAMNLSYMFKDFKNIENEEDEMKPTLLSSKGISSLRLQRSSCDSPPILCNAHLVLIFLIFIFSLQLYDLLTE